MTYLMSLLTISEYVREEDFNQIKQNKSKVNYIKILYNYTVLWN